MRMDRLFFLMSVLPPLMTAIVGLLSSPILIASRIRSARPAINHGTLIGGCNGRSSTWHAWIPLHPTPQGCQCEKRMLERWSSG